MAKQRYVNTRFWSDGYISSLKFTQRYLFLYFLTNEHTNIGGIYELPVRTIAFETDLPTKTILEAIEAFSKAGKIFYINGWVYVKNFSKHQAVNEKTKIGIENSLKEVAPDVLAQIKQIDMGSYTPSMEYELSESKLKLKSKLKSTSEPEVSQDIPNLEIPEFINLWRDINPAYRKFFENKTERKAVADLLKISPFRDWVIFLPLLQKMNADQYAKGKSTKPTELLRNIGHFKAWLDQKRAPDPKRKIAEIPND